MSKRYSYPAVHVRGDAIAQQMTVGTTVNTLSLAQVSKELNLTNLGASTVFLTFDGSVPDTTTSYPLAANATLKLDGQFDTIKGICSTATADVRVLSVI